MGREFLEIFTEWAESYDWFVQGNDPQYQEVFRDYDEILNDIVQKSGNWVLEFGVGTGNLTQKLVDAGKTVFAIEPSAQMRELAQLKLEDKIQIHDGDLLKFPPPVFRVDTIVGSYVFHHLTDSEKTEAIEKYGFMLDRGGKAIFADTMFLSAEIRDKLIGQAKDSGHFDLAEDLEREYYPLMTTLKNIFEAAGFQVRFSQFNEFVWIVEGEKIE